MHCISNFASNAVASAFSVLMMKNVSLKVPLSKIQNWIDVPASRPRGASISTSAALRDDDPCNPSNPCKPCAPSSKSPPQDTSCESRSNPCKPCAPPSKSPPQDTSCESRSNPCKPCAPPSKSPPQDTSCGSSDPCGFGGRSGGTDSLKSLKDKVCVITGGAEGIGYEMADAYLKRDAQVAILLDINKEKGMEAQKTLNGKYGENKAVFCVCDVVTDLEESSKNIFAAYKNVDVLVNNAGILDQIPAKTLIDINVAALIEWSLKYWNHMRKDKGGKGGTIVNLSSIYGYRIDQFHPIYQSSKFAVMGFTKALGHEYTFKKTGVRIMAICPGFTHSKMTSKARPWDDMYGEDLNKFLKNQAWQNLDACGMCAIKSFETGESGSAWLIEGNKVGEVILKHMVCF